MRTGWRVAMGAALLMLLAAGCAAPPTPDICDQPGSSGSVTILHDGAHTLSCFGGTLDGGLFITTPYRGSLEPHMVFGIILWPSERDIYSDDGGVAVGAPCGWETGKTVSLASNCMSIWATHLTLGGFNLPRPDWSVVGGRLAVGASAAPEGTLTVVQWPADAGQPVGISFSSDAALTYMAGPAFSVPVSGSLGLTPH